MDDIDYAGSQHFPYAYFFRTLDSAVGGKTQYAQTGDKDGQDGKVQKKAAEVIFRSVLFVEKLIQESELKGTIGDDPVPMAFDCPDGFRQPGRRHFDGNDPELFREYA
jgi:hypothetical protein